MRVLIMLLYQYALATAVGLVVVSIKPQRGDFAKVRLVYVCGVINEEVA